MTSAKLKLTGDATMEIQQERTRVKRNAEMALISKSTHVMMLMSSSGTAATGTVILKKAGSAQAARS